jgi:uncharacterized protein
MNTGFQLNQLQDIDTSIDKANQRIKDIEICLVDDTKIKKAKDLVEACEASYLKQKTLFNLTDNDIQSKKIKMNQSESNLYSGTIVNSKELQDLQKEITSLANYISKSEDELMNLYADLEITEKELDNSKENLKTVLSEFENSKALLNGERNKLVHLIDNLKEKKDSITSAIEPSILDIYNSLRKSKNGIAVARLLDDSCSTCGTSLTANQCQQARSQVKLFNCPSCGRILYGS